MANLVACKTCNGQVASNAPKCPHCGQRSPGTDFKVAKIIGLVAAGVVGLGIVGAWISDDAASAAFNVGSTYAVSGVGYVCDSLDNLAETQANGRLADGCELIDKGQSVELLEKDAAVVRVRVIAPLSMANNFEGWTDADRLTPLAAQ